MAELSITPVAPVTPAVQSAPANASNTPASGADPASQQASFAHVLKERSDANNTQQQSPPASTAKADKSDTQAAPDKATDQTATTADAAGDVARLLASMAHGGANAAAATDAKSDAKSDTADQTVADLLAGLKDKKAARDKDKPGADPTAQLNAPDTSTIIANPAVMPDKIASGTATIAASTDQRGDLKTTLDLASSKTSDKQAAALAAKPDLHDKLDKSVPPSDSKLLATATSATDSAAKTSADAAARAAADLASTPDASATNRANSALTNAVATQQQQQPSAVEHAVSTAVGTRGWVEEVGQKLTWTANSDNGRASLVLTPPHMGRIEVSINVSGDQASASFIAPSSAAREALQDAMPRLRELMAQAGINLGQTDVSAGQSGQPQADSRGTSGGGSRQSISGIAATDSGVATGRSAWIQQGRGMIDTFA